MAVSLRRYGEKMLKHERSMYRNSVRDVRQYLSEQFVSSVINRAILLSENVFENNTFSFDRWKAIQRQFLNISVMVPFTDFNKFVGALAKRLQRDAFFTARKLLVSDMQSLGFKIKSADSKPERRFAKVDFLLGNEKTARLNEHEGYFILDEVGGIFVAEAGSTNASVVLGAGKLNEEFKAFLNRQFENGLDPFNRITTLNQEEIKKMQELFLRNISKGLDPTFTRDQFVASVIGDLKRSDSVKKLEYNALRIIRTSYGRAAAASNSLFAVQNKEIIRALERVADGRPCLACVFLDGKEYPVGSVLDDHPNGMCIFVPIVKTLDELGFDESKIPDKFKSGFEKQWRGYVSWRTRFYRLSDDEKRKIFGNSSLYNLWQRERFKVERLVTKKGGFYVPMTYKEALLKSEKWATVSNPHCKIYEFSDNTFRKIAKSKTKQRMQIVDIYDNEAGLNIVFKKDLPKQLDVNALIMKDKLGGNGFGIGAQELFMLSKKDPDLLNYITHELDYRSDKIFLGANKEIRKNFFKNEVNRKLGLFVRYADDGSEYFVFTDAELSEFKKLVAKIYGAEPATTKTVSKGLSAGFVDKFERIVRKHFSGVSSFEQLMGKMQSRYSIFYSELRGILGKKEHQIFINVLDDFLADWTRDSDAPVGILFKGLLEKRASFANVAYKGKYFDKVEKLRETFDIEYSNELKIYRDKLASRSVNFGAEFAKSIANMSDVEFEDLLWRQIQILNDLSTATFNVIYGSEKITVFRGFALTLKKGSTAAEIEKFNALVDKYKNAKNLSEAVDGVELNALNSFTTHLKVASTFSTAYDPTVVEKVYAVILRTEIGADDLFLGFYEDSPLWVGSEREIIVYGKKDLELKVASLIEIKEKY